MFLPVPLPLQALVEGIVYMNFDFSKSQLNPVIKYPWVATTHLFFTICDEPVRVLQNDLHLKTIPNNFLLGPKLLNDVVDLGSYRHAIGVSFKPCGLQQLCGFPISDIRNMEVDAASVLGNEIDTISQRLKEAKDVEEIHSVVCEFLLQRLHRSKYKVSAFENAIALQQKNNGNLSIKELANLSGIGMRQFERESLKKLGMSPKLYSRLMRFSNAYLAKEMNPQLKWIDITYQFGYADQMHLIDDKHVKVTAWFSYSGYYTNNTEEIYHYNPATNEIYFTVDKVIVQEYPNAPNTNADKSAGKKYAIKIGKQLNSDTYEITIHKDYTIDNGENYIIGKPSMAHQFVQLVKVQQQ